MEKPDEEIFAELLFKRYETVMTQLHEVRLKRAEAEATCQNLQEEIRFLDYRISHQAAFEMRKERADATREL
jgi:hypothetical protein